MRGTAPGGRDAWLWDLWCCGVCMIADDAEAGLSGIVV